MINFETNSGIILWSYDPLKILAYKKCQLDISESVLAKDLKLSQIISNDK